MKKICVFNMVLIGMVLICLVTQVAAASDDELFEQGVALLKQEKAEAAVEVFTRLIEQVPDSPDAYRNRGVGYMKLNRYEEAVQDFEKAMALKPDLKDLYSNMGVAWYYKKDYPKAISFYNKELDLRPDNHYGYFNRAICRAALGAFDLALTDVEKSLALFPNHYLALCLKGDLLVKTGRLQKARLAYQKAVTLDSEQGYAKKRLLGLEKEGGASSSVKKDVLGQPPLKTVKQEKVKSPGLDDENALEIQAGAYLGKENAQKMLEKIQEKGYSARILELTGAKGRQWFLVRIGRFANRAEALAAMGQVKTRLGGTFVVRPANRF